MTDERNMSAHEVWLRSIEAELERVRKTKGYGALRIEFQNGVITRTLLERSVKDPRDLEAPGGS